MKSCPKYFFVREGFPHQAITKSNVFLGTNIKSGRIVTTFYVASSKARVTFTSFKSQHQNIIDELNKLSNSNKGRKYAMIGRW